MPKIGRAQGATIGGSGVVDSSDSVLVRGQRLVVGDGYLAFLPSPGAAPDLILERGFDGRLSGLIERGPGVSGEVGEPLRAARAAWANNLFNWLILGTSIDMGYYASSILLRWAQLAAKNLEVASGKTACVGYVPRHSLTNYGWVWTTSGTATEFQTTGLGYASTTVAANGGYFETTQTCDRFWVRYTAGTLIGKFSVKIDSAEAVEVAAVSGSITGGHTWDSGPLDPGSHTVRFTSTDAVFPARLEGIYFFNGNGNATGSQGALSAANSRTGTGVRVWNGAKFGAKASTFSAASATTWWTDGLDKVNPHLVTMGFMPNEVTAGDTPASMRGHILSIIDRIDSVMATASQPRPSYVLMIMHGTGAASTTTNAYAQAIRDAATARDAAVFDFREVAGFVGTPTADIYGFTSGLDGSARVHLSDLGQRLLGQTFSDYLLRAFGGTRV
jgi:hypothetical protein